MPGTSSTTYRERLAVPLRWWVLGTAFVASLWLAVAVAAPGAVAWAVGAVGLAALAALLLTYGAARVTVADGQLRAGRARIGGEHLGTVEVLDAESTRRTAGPQADVRAFLLIRPYVRRAVKVEITDPVDPAPYWLLSSRRPEELAAAISGLREPHRPA